MSWSGVGKSKQRLRSTLLKIGGKSNTSRSTLLRIFMRGIGRLLSLRGSHITWQAKRGREYDFAQSPKDEVGMHPRGLTDSQIQLISGHESKKSLEIYQHLSLQSVDKAYHEAVQNAGV